MIDEISKQLTQYQQAWKTLVAERADQAFFASAVPISVGWKVPDLAAFDAAFAELREHADQAHVINKNDRWLAAIHLHTAVLPWDISVINLMQRRPASEDAIGLDNVNFYLSHFATADEVLTNEPELKWTHESNGEHSTWISVWFADTEAKLRAETVLDVCLHEFRAVRDTVLAGKA